jgi:hypothetical protein
VTALTTTFTYPTAGEKVVDENVGANALKLAGEVFIPGASQMMSGEIGRGLLSNVLAGAASVALVGSGGILGALGGLAILGIKINSYASSVTGRGILDVGGDMFSRRRSEAAETTPTRATTGSARSGSSSSAT